MKVLLTGSGGYIGIVTAPVLMERGHDVIGLDTGFYQSGWLYNGVKQFGKKAGAKVGTDRSVFVLRSAKTLYGSGTATLPGGTIHFQGVAIVENGAFAIPVTRGTGLYAGAKGHLLIPLTPPGTKLVPNVYRLTYAPVA